MKLSTILALTTAAWILAGPVWAHHSDARYDENSVIGLQGAVTRLVWRNPHITFYIEAENDQGELVEWGVESGSIPIMSRSGWTEDILVPGDEVIVRAHPDKGHRTHVMMISFEKADGSTWAQNEGDFGTTATASSMEGVWKGTAETTSEFVQAFESIALTPAGAAARAEFDYQTHSPIADCIPPPTPGSVIGSTVYLNQIEVLDDRMIIRSEFFDAVRTVYFDGRAHPENGERTNQGHSIGRREGDVLVVDTTLFADHRDASGDGVPSGAQKHLVERFYLNDDGSRLVVDIELSDPEFLAETLRTTKSLVYVPELEFFTYNCDPEISRLSGFD